MTLASFPITTGTTIWMNSTVSHSESEVCSMVSITHREDLQRYLSEGEYPPFQSVAMFESNFIQISRKGKNVDIHNHLNEATIAIISTNNKLPLPNIMLIARPVPMPQAQVSSGCRTEQLVLTRLLPLKFVRISVHDPDRQRIKLKLINGNAYYLQLYASPEEQKSLFNRWLSLIYLLHHPPAHYLHPNSHVPRDNLSVQILGSDEEEAVAAPRWQAEGQEDVEPEEKEKEQASDATSPLGESNSRRSIAQGPSTETKQDPNSESREHESLTPSNTVKNYGDPESGAASSSLHSSTAFGQARQSLAVSDGTITTAKDRKMLSQTSGKQKDSARLEWSKTASLKE